MKNIGSMLALKALADMVDDDKPSHSLTLEQQVASYNKAEHFQVGDLVVWKDGLSNARLPESGKKALVVEVLEEPILNTEKDASSHYYNEKLDIRLAVQSTSGTLCFYYFDSRRFTLAKRYES